MICRPLQAYIKYELEDTLAIYVIQTLPEPPIYYTESQKVLIPFPVCLC